MDRLNLISVGLGSWPECQNPRYALVSLWHVNVRAMLSECEHFIRKLLNASFNFLLSSL